MKLFFGLYTFYKRRNSTRHLSQSLFKRVIRLLLTLLLLVIINSSAMVYFEKMDVGDALWLSSTTVTTVGYGDFSPATWQGRLATVLTMYMFAITVLSLLIAETVEWRVFTMEKKRKGLLEWKHMTNHIQIINTPDQDTDRYLLRLIKQIQITPEFSGLPIQLLTRKYPDGLPEKIAHLKVLHRTGEAEDSDIIHSINLESAKYVIIIAPDATDTKSDCLTLDILCRVREMNKTARVLVEAVSDENKERFLKFGANIVTRPVRAYPEMLVRCIAHPGTETVLENLFDYNDDFLSRFDCQFSNIAWKDIVSKCVMAGYGIPVAFIGDEGVNTNPPADYLCTGTALIAMVNQSHNVSPQSIEQCLKS